jgi:beta-lactamase class A
MIDLTSSLHPNVTWSVQIDDARETLAKHGPDRELPVASIGKLLLLSAVAQLIESGDLDAEERLAKANVAAVKDSGLWQHLHEPTLSVDSLAMLVGSVSDNLATNVLLNHVGLQACATTAARLRLRHTAMHDIIRDRRDPTVHPATVASSTAADLVALMKTLRSGHLLGPRASARVIRWLAHGTDHSMVLAPLGLDPLAHGYDVGTRADCGLVEHGDHWVAYAVLARWDDPAVSEQEVLASMGAVGRIIAGHLDIPTRGRHQQHVFHLARHADWAAAVAGDGRYAVSTLGKTLEDVGFVHCSTATQWPVVRAAVYDGVDDLVLLEIDPAQVGAPVRYEPGEPGGVERFPHVYGPIPTRAVVAEHPLIPAC